MNKKEAENISRASNILYFLSKELEEQGEKRKQTYGYLANMTNGKIRSYCALGVLGCHRNMIYVARSPMLKEDVLVEPNEYQIINFYGLSDKLLKPLVISYYRDGKKKNGVEVYTAYRLSSLITTLNDHARYSFKDIARFIKELGNQKYVTTCSKQEVKRATNFVEEYYGKEYIKEDKPLIKVEY